MSRKYTVEERKELRKDVSELWDLLACLAVSESPKESNGYFAAVYAFLDGMSEKTYLDTSKAE